MPHDPAPTPTLKDGVYRLVCAAMKMDDGLIVPGVRHFSPDMRAVLERIYGSVYWRHVVTQGFIDSHGNFLDRKEAADRALNTGQADRCDLRCGVLFSEDLY